MLENKSSEIKRGGSSLATKSLVTGTAVLLGGLLLRRHVRNGRKISLNGKTVLITGGSRGLGLVLARAAARRGAKVAICARDDFELSKAGDELRRNDADVLEVNCDVTDAAQVAAMVKTVQRHFGSIDVLINNAGTISVGPVANMTAADFDDAMETHFKGPLNTTLATLPVMRRQRGGRIVNISSIGGKVPVPHLTPYCASKFALTGFSESLRTELVREKIYVTTVSPGLIRTGSTLHAKVKGQHKKEYAWFVIGDTTPIISTDPMPLAERILDAAEYGEAEVIAPAIAKFSSLFHGMFPGISCEIASIVNRVLPSPGGIGRRSAKGIASDSWRVPSVVRKRNKRAARKNNEL